MPMAESASSSALPSPSSVSSGSGKHSSTPLPAGEFGPDHTATGEKIKRPMNAFMVWAQMRRAEITAQSTKVHNSLISKALGAEWREMSEEQKAPFVQRAKELRDELFREHPNYVYRPRKRKQRFSAYPSKTAPSAPSTDSPTPLESATAPVSTSPQTAFSEPLKTSAFSGEAFAALAAAAASSPLPMLLYPQLPPALLPHLLQLQLLSQFAAQQ